MAYCAPVLGLEAVYQAINDERVRGWVNAYWDDAVQQVPLGDDEAGLPRRPDRPVQQPADEGPAGVAMDGTQKLPIRIVPHVQTLAGRGEVAKGAARAIAGWVLHLRGVGAP